MTDILRSYGISANGEAMPISNPGANVAEDSLKLGGKPPEAYIAVNMLDNSDFTNPVTEAESEIVRWKGSSAALTIVDGGLSVSASNKAWSVTQTIQYDVTKLQGKSITVASRVRDVTNTIGIRARIADSAGTYLGQIMAITSEQGLLVMSGVVPTNAATWTFELGNSSLSDYSATFEWVALYEGSYTAETLPPYVPKGYAIELLACKVAETGGIDADTLGGNPASSYVQHDQVVNDFTTTEEGYVADARALKVLNDKITYVDYGVDAGEDNNLNIDFTKYGNGVYEIVANGAYAIVIVWGSYYELGPHHSVAGSVISMSNGILSIYVGSWYGRAYILKKF